VLAAQIELLKNKPGEVEAAIVGNEGVLGISLFMGGDSTPSRAVVQSAGYGFPNLRRAAIANYALLRSTRKLFHWNRRSGPVRRYGVRTDRWVSSWLVPIHRPATAFAANANLLVSSLAYFLGGIGPGLRVILLFAVCSVVTLLNVAGSRDAMRGLSVLTILKFLPLVAMAEMVAEEQTIGIWSDVPDSAVRFIRWEAVVRLAAGGLSSRQQS
jgi:hypothetical protein